MQLVEDGMAQDGWVIWAGEQREGRGQRGKQWVSNKDNLMMTLIAKPHQEAEGQFLFGMAIASTLAQYFGHLSSEWQVAIKWPNDIFINDKKACGILIENVFRGASWAYSIIGLGINLNQKEFPGLLPHATSLTIESGGKDFDFLETITDIRAGILNALRHLKKVPPQQVIDTYNQLLFAKDRDMWFENKADGTRFLGKPYQVNGDGNLLIGTAEGIQAFRHGDITWIL